MKAIGLVLLVTVAVGGLVALSSSPASAQQPPFVANLTPFSAAANYMSLPGYLRWLMFKQQGDWMTRQEAVDIVNEQETSSPPSG
jgi:hypothetical protein